MVRAQSKATNGLRRWLHIEAEGKRLSKGFAVSLVRVACYTGNLRLRNNLPFIHPQSPIVTYSQEMSFSSDPFPAFRGRKRQIDLWLSTTLARISHQL
jgi:hypothetical protein